MTPYIPTTIYLTTVTDLWNAVGDCEPELYPTVEDVAAAHVALGLPGYERLTRDDVHAVADYIIETRKEDEEDET